MSATISIVIGIFVALVGSGGIVFVALRFNREEASGLVKTVKDVAEELRIELLRTQTERDTLRQEVEKLRDEIEKLRLLLEGRPHGSDQQ